MAEILGLAASIIALIGLVDTVTKTASKYVTTAKGSQAILLPLISKIGSLRGVLVAIQIQLKTKSNKLLVSIALEHVKTPLELCSEILKMVNVRLDNLNLIGGYVVGSILDKQTTIYIKYLDDLIPILQLALDADNLASVNRIEQEIKLLQMDSIEQFRSLQDAIHAHHETTLQWREEAERSARTSVLEQTRKRIFDWLMITDPGTNHRSACQRHQPGTGAWLSESMDYREWETGNISVLWLSAMAGAGKTVLMSTIVQNLIAKHGDAKVAYFYFDFKDSAKQEVLSLLASWISQIARALQTLPQNLLNLYRRHSVRNPDHPSLPHVSELVEVLGDMVKLQPSCFLVVDALDECAHRPLLLDTLTVLFGLVRPHCKILCTSRAEADIKHALSKIAVKELQIQNCLVDRDVLTYVQAVLSSDERLKCHRPAIKELIEEKMVGGAKGMFRWVQCQIDHIKTLRTAKDVKGALGELPPDLDQTYDEILRSVPRADTGYLRCALQFTVFAARPMTIAEVVEAVIIDSDTRIIDEDSRLQRPEDLLDIGKSLFIQPHDGSDGKRLLELSHYSVKEYLLSERISKGPAARFHLGERPAQLDISVRCLTYLAQDIFEEVWQDFDAKTWESTKGDLGAKFLIQGHKQRLAEYPFLDYSARHCFDHCQDEEIQRAIAPLARDIFSAKRSGRFRNMTYTCVFKPDESWGSLYQRTFRYSLISVAARFGLTSLVAYLLRQGVPADYISPKPAWVEEYFEGQTALYRAAEFGHERLCRVLIEAGASLEGIGNYDCPLSAAGRSGRSEIVRLMLDVGADVRRDTTSIGLTLLTAWWKFVEGDQQQKDVLEVFRTAGAKWVTIGLLKAFSAIGTPIVRRTAELLTDNAPGIRYIPDAPELIHTAVEEIETHTLDALQWLVRDPGGIPGLKVILENIILALFNSQPQLLTQNSISYTHKYNAEEVLAENITRIYFRPAQYQDVTASETFRAVSQSSLLAAPWENVFMSDKSPSAMTWNADDLIICGDVLRALIRGRWDTAYSQFYI